MLLKLQNYYYFMAKTLLLIFVMCASPIQAAEQAINWTFIDDPNSELTVEQVIEMLDEGQGQQVSGLSRGFTHATTWLSAPGPDIESVVHLFIEPGYLNDLQVFVVKHASSTPLFSSYETADRGVPSFAVALDKQFSSAQRVIVRLNTTSAHVLNAFWLDEKAFDKHNKIRSFLTGGYLAVIVIALLMYVTLGLRLKESMHIIYAFYLLMVAILVAYQYGFVSALPSRSWTFFVHFSGVATAMSFAFMALFFKMFFSVDKTHFPRSNYFLMVVMVLGVLTALSAWSEWYVELAPLMYLAGYLLMLNGAYLAYIVGFRENKVEGRLFFIAFAQSCLAVVITTSTLNQWIPFTEFGINAYSISVVLQAFLLMVGFVERLHYAEGKALKAAEESEFKAVTIAGEMTREVFEASEKLQASLKRERDLRQSHEHFIDTINHEYRTPLAIIKGNVDMIALKFPEVEAFSEKIDRAMQRLRQLFDQTLRGYREMNTDQVSMEPVDIVAFVKDVVASSLIGSRVEVIYPEHPVIIQTDLNLLRTALLNILDNADKYIYPRDGSAHIDLNVSEDEHLIHIRIANDYDPENGKPSSSLFQPYVRGPKQTGVSGLGFGLYLVKSNIEKVGGKIRLLPSQSNKFAVLIVLPRSEPQS
jgi:two-component system, sensor histidine kinase LadS